MEYAVENNIVHIKKGLIGEISPAKPVEESIIDLERKKLSPDVFTEEDDKLLPKIRDFVVNSFKDIFKSVGIGDDKIKTIYIIGSILGKYYNDYTDIDCQAVIETDAETMVKIWDEIAKRYKVGYVYIDNNTHPINFYVREFTTDAELYPKSIDGVYDIWKDEWVQKNQPRFIIDPTIYKVAMNWSRKIENDIGELRRDIIEYLFYSEGEQNKDKLSVDIWEIESFRTMKFKEAIYDLSNIRSTMSAMKEWRTLCQTELTKEYEILPAEITVDYKNSSLFDGIIVWKLIDRFGYLTAMGNLKYLLIRYEKTELTKEQLIIEVAKVLNLDDLWKHK